MLKSQNDDVSGFATYAKTLSMINNEAQTLSERKANAIALYDILKLLHVKDPEIAEIGMG